MITVINATDKINGRNIPYIISAFLIDVGLLIDQIKVDDKSNEITAIPELFELIDIKGATITIDSIGTQEEIVNSVVEKGGYYYIKYLPLMLKAIENASHADTNPNGYMPELLQTKVYQLGKALYNRMGKVRFDKFVASLPMIEKEILAKKKEK